MKSNGYGGVEHVMEPGKIIVLDQYDTWVPLPEAEESILSQILRVMHRARPMNASGRYNEATCSDNA